MKEKGWKLNLAFHIVHTKDIHSISTSLNAGLPVPFPNVATGAKSHNVATNNLIGDRTFDSIRLSCACVQSKTRVMWNCNKYLKRK